MCPAYTGEYGFERRVVRLHNIYSPCGTYCGGREKVPAVLCRKVAGAERGGEIEIWGGGDQTRSFCVMSDCVQGIYRLMQTGYPQPPTLGTEDRVTVNELARMIIRLSGKGGVTRHADGP
ncbi:MAG: hypothetical protein DLM57_07060 [Pseudonocardiales bacterium]|nr:MAG: hypothetical protein DLM57_07060 [Pseudonocardiales bacterium]